MVSRNRVTITAANTHGTWRFPPYGTTKTFRAEPTAQRPLAGMDDVLRQTAPAVSDYFHQALTPVLVALTLTVETAYTQTMGCSSRLGAHAKDTLLAMLSSVYRGAMECTSRVSLYIKDNLFAMLEASYTRATGCLIRMSAYVKDALLARDLDVETYISRLNHTILRHCGIDIEELYARCITYLGEWPQRAFDSLHNLYSKTLGYLFSLIPAAVSDNFPYFLNAGLLSSASVCLGFMSYEASIRMHKLQGHIPRGWEAFIRSRDEDVPLTDDLETRHQELMDVINRDGRYVWMLSVAGLLGLVKYATTKALPFWQWVLLYFALIHIITALLYVVLKPFLRSYAPYNGLGNDREAEIHLAQKMYQERGVVYVKGLSKKDRQRLVENFAEWEAEQEAARGAWSEEGGWSTKGL